MAQTPVPNERISILRAPRSVHGTSCWLQKSTRACESLSSVLCFEPVYGCRHAEYAHEGAFGLLIAGRDGAPLFQSRPAALDEVAVGVDPGRAGHWGLIALRRNGRTRAEVPDEHAERMRGVTPIGHDPQRQSGEKAQQ